MKTAIVALGMALALSGLSPAWAGILDGQQSFAPLVKKTAPAVVNIYARRMVRERVRISPFFDDPFFGQFFGGQGFAGPERERVEKSLGSGVILDASGIVVTNQHVVKDAEDITVVTSEGREFEATKILGDAKIDLAVLKVETKGEKLPALDLADSDATEVGDIVLAIGNPFGVGQTVTSGIVSGLARTDVGISDYGFFIQTDAAINPGNSGGALIDTQGRLVGVNTAIYSKDGGSLGIGFAIPANMVRTVLGVAKTGKKLVHPWSGVASQDVTSEMTQSLGLQKVSGTLVSKVYPDSPAEKAGLKAGDVILAADGHEVRDTKALRYRLAAVPLGSAVKLTVWRGGRSIELSLVTMPPPETPARDQTKIQGPNPLSGAVVANISPALREEIEGIVQESGVAVVRIEEGNARRLGLKTGDVLLSINGKKIDSVARLVRLMKDAGMEWSISIGRDGRVINVVVRG